MEEVNLVLEMAEEAMKKSLQHLDDSFVQIRAGKASPNMLSTVKVDYYGSLTPLQQVANVNTPDAMTISLQPWEKDILKDIETAIINSNLGFAPNNNGETIIINVPPLTEERRRDLVKQAKAECENAKVSIRTARKEANQETAKIEGLAEDAVKNAEADVQNLTDRFIKRVEDKMIAKEKEIMTV